MNICGGRVLETGGRDNKLIRGAGVDSVLHTVRTEGITHSGASLMICEDCKGSSLNRARFIDVVLEGVPSARSFNTLLLRGVDFDGVLFWSGLADADLDGVAAVSFLGVVADRDGVLDPAFPADFEPPPIELSRNV